MSSNHSSRFGYVMLLVLLVLLPGEVLAAPGFVDKKDFLSVKKGQLLADVRKGFGDKLYHGFTIVIGSNVWTLAVCRVDVPGVDGGLESYMLFRDGAFHGFANEIYGCFGGGKVSRYSLFGMRDSHEHFTTEPKDASCLEPLVTHPFSQADYEDRYNRCATNRYHGGGTSYALVPLLIPAIALSPLWAPPMVWDYHKNYRLRKALNGFEVGIGQAETNLVAKLGHLVEQKSFDSGISVARFGRGDYVSRIPRRHECPDLIVVSSNGLVRAVYSDFPGWW